MGKSNRDETSAKSLLSLHLPKLEVNEVRDVSLGEGYRQTFGSRVGSCDAPGACLRKSWPTVPDSIGPI